MARPLDNRLDNAGGTQLPLTLPTRGQPVPYNTGIVPPGFGQPAPPPVGSRPPIPLNSSKTLPASVGPSTVTPTGPQPPAAPVTQQALPSVPGVTTASASTQPVSLDSGAYVANPVTGAPSAPSGAPQSGYTGGVVDVGRGSTLPAAQASGDVVQNYLSDLLNSGSSYMRNAALRGIELAGARGLGNSSIAAGSAQRSAIEAAMPILNNILSLHESREGRSFAQDESQLARQLEAELQAQGFSFQDAQNAANRALSLTQSRESNALTREEGAANRAQSVNNAILGARLDQERAAQDFEFRRTLQNDTVAQQDWLASNAFNREFNASLSMLPIQNASQLNNMIAQYALENPEVYTQEIASGMTNFFSNNFMSIVAQYFPDLFVEEGGTQ